MGYLNSDHVADDLGRKSEDRITRDLCMGEHKPRGLDEREIGYRRG